MQLDEDTLLKAIDDYELYTKSQRETLKILIKVADDDDIASVGVKYLIEKLNLTRLRVYSIFEKFTK